MHGDIQGTAAWPAVALGLTLAIAGTPAAGAAQDANIQFPVDTIEERLAHGEFQIIDRRASRGLPNERTDRAALAFEDGTMMLVKWAPAPPGGEEFNNIPRYEVAAYEIQPLFLEPHEYVVPPTVLRAFPLDWYREIEPDMRPTFNYADNSVLVALQYWLFNVTPEGFWDEDRFATDTLYARHFANFNILTYLIRHNDENEGNYLISASPDNPRVFSVDNGLAFQSEASDRGRRWRQIRVDRLPETTIERLRGLTEQDIARQLATVAQFRIGPDEGLTPEPPGPPVNPDQGVRREDDVIQFGLTSWEIQRTWRRLQDLLEEVAEGEYELF